jgi:nitroreductase
MDVISAIRTRRSIRRYKSTAVDAKTLELVLEAARWAPSWANSQCWRFIVVRDKHIRAELAQLLAGILPHGILEIPALIIAQAAAMSFGATVVTAVFKKERRNRILPSFKQNLRWLGLALFLLVPAAIIETFVTPLLLD